MDVVWTTGARVKRSTWFGDVFYEELSMKKDAVNLERMNKGAPLLNNHGSYSGGLRDILGKVVEGSAKIVKGEGRATVIFSKRAEIADLVQDIKDGIMPNLSVGYRIDKMVETDEETEDGAPVLRAESWTPMEISFVTIPADHNAQARSLDQTGESHTVLVERKGEETGMGKKLKKPTVAKRSPGHPVHTEGEDSSLETSGSQAEGTEEGSDDSAEEQDDLASVDDAGDDVADDVSDDEADGDDEVEESEEQDDEESEDEESEEPAAPAKKAPAKKAAAKKGGKKRSLDVNQVRAEEMKRQSTIRKNVRTAGLPEEFADQLVGDAKVTEQIAGKRIFAELEKRSSTPTMNQRIEVSGMKTELARREAAVRGILHRTNPEKFKLKNDGDQEFRQGSILAAARHFLAVEGVRDAYTMSNSEVAQRSLHTTSDFANVLGQAANISLREGYDEVPATYKEFTRQKNVSDFKQIRSVEISNGGRLEKVNEHGEYRRTSLTTGQEAYALEKFGTIIGRTWELIVNDDIGALTEIPQRLGRRAKELENITFWNLILSNPTMSDGFAFFSAQHGNLGTGAALGISPVGAARASMRVQKDLDGELIAGLAPEWLITPAILETVADQFLTPVTPATDSAVNPFKNKLKGMVEPMLDANSLISYYLFASKSKRAIAEMSLLDGKGPEIFTREGFNVDGYETKVRYVFGMGLVDWRGAYKQPGA